MDAPALRFNTQKESGNKAFSRILQNNYKRYCFSLQQAWSTEVFTKHSYKHASESRHSVDKGAECLGQRHLFFINFLTVECGVSHF